jgi:hypothetical protein
MPARDGCRRKQHTVADEIGVGPENPRRLRDEATLVSVLQDLAHEVADHFPARGQTVEKVRLPALDVRLDHGVSKLDVPSERIESDARHSQRPVSMP